ncbi:macrophage erythroblast attacher [Ditylenchus destructor]|uniref:E3 ubiquitin-protein transferase MAEA n=1 Tax=Ditylenchus destructor TaxID=166010 RepID=A0AAD4R0G4_9BILA|nr:macrophage erythroblast attacher [Ditylenchus destructor]
MSLSGDLNEVNCLEYGLLKVPYELLNKKFRASQKTIDQYNYFFKKDGAALENKLKSKTAPIPLSEVADDVQKLYARMATFQAESEKATSEEIEAAENLLQRADYLKQGTSDIPTERIVSNVERLYSRTFQHESNRATTEGTSSNSIAQECFRKQRLNRFITDHLLRAGYFATAQKLSEYAGTDFSCHKYIFHVAKQVEESLARKDLSICLNWITDNRSKLHRLNSTFETEVRIQQCVELIRNGRKLDAINSSKSFFGNLPAKQWKEGNLLSLFGLLGLGLQDGIPNEPYQKLLNDDRYDYLIDLFRRENQRIFQISSQSPFSACLHAGLAAHKTPHCRRNAASKCVVCSDLYDLAEGLPVAHASNSRLICAASGEPLNEENQPMMLPNGRVYGEKSIHRLTKDREICCPRTNEVFSVDDIKRVYVL